MWEAASFWSEMLNITPWMSPEDLWNSESWTWLAQNARCRENAPASLKFLPLLGPVRQCVEPSHQATQGMEANKIKLQTSASQEPAKTPIH